MVGDNEIDRRTPQAPLDVLVLRAVAEAARRLSTWGAAGPLGAIEGAGVPVGGRCRHPGPTERTRAQARRARRERQRGDRPDWATDAT
jgi:hypothetical protein